MLSICIPVYNFDVRELISELTGQGIKLNIEFEIIVIDDASKHEFKIINHPVRKIPNVKYIELSENIGRSRIRNLIAEYSSYNYLLFIDCDSRVNNKNFIQNYIANFKNNAVIVGGVAYENESPGKDFLLRWNYGKNRETIAANERIKEPYNSFKTFNFCIPRQLFLNIKFDENLEEYGHEDTLFGYQLGKQEINIIHIENPLIHLGIEKNSEFIQKTEKSLENLFKINSIYKQDPEFINSIRILRSYSKLRPFNRFLIKLFFKSFNSCIKYLMINWFPNVRLLDIYKIGYICSIE